MRNISYIVTATCLLALPFSFAIAGEAPKEYQNYSMKLMLLIASGKKVKPEDVVHKGGWSVNPNSYIGPSSYYARLLSTIDPDYIKKNTIKSLYSNGQPGGCLLTAKLFTELITELEEADVDYSADANLKSLGALFGDAYRSAKLLRKMGIKNTKPEMLELAVIKLQLLSGYKDADSQLLDAKRELASITEKVKTETQVAELKAAQDQKATEEKILAEKAHAEALRQEKLKVERARAEAERAKLAQARAEKMAKEIEELTNRNLAEIEKYSQEEAAALIARKEAELKAYEARERERIAREIADKAARQQAEAILEKRKREMAGRLSGFRSRMKGKLSVSGDGGNVRQSLEVEVDGSVETSLKGDGISGRSRINADGSGEAEYEINGQKAKVTVDSNGNVTTKFE